MIVIHDGKGYWVRMRRPEGRIVHLWSPRKRDATSFSFLEVAEKIASTIPQEVTFEPSSPQKEGSA